MRQAPVGSSLSVLIRSKKFLVRRDVSITVETYLTDTDSTSLPGSGEETYDLRPATCDAVPKVKVAIGNREAQHYKAGEEEF
jgi:hypothetical protein